MIIELHYPQSMDWTVCILKENSEEQFETLYKGHDTLNQLGRRILEVLSLQKGVTVKEFYYTDDEYDERF